MRNPFRSIVAFALVTALVTTVAYTQQPAVLFVTADSIAGAVPATGTGSTCILVKYRGTTAGKPTVEVAAGGDLTFKIAGAADVTTGSAADGIWDLSAPAATVDTMGEFVNLVNTTGSNWVAVLVNCLASDLTNNTLITLAATDAANPKGVSLFSDETIASATSIFSVQAALLPGGMSTDIRFFLSGGPVGNTTGSTKVNPNPFAGWQVHVQHMREKITSSGTIALYEILGVNRTYDSSGKVTEVVRSLFSVTGAATTVEGINNFHAGPVLAAPGEVVIVRQRTATDLTAVNISASGYMVRR